MNNSPLAQRTIGRRRALTVASLLILAAIADARPRAREIGIVVGETNDGKLNDIRSRPVGRDDVFAAIKNAKDGAVEEGFTTRC